MESIKSEEIKKYVSSKNVYYSGEDPTILEGMKKLRKQIKEESLKKNKEKPPKDKVYKDPKKLYDYEYQRSDKYRNYRRELYQQKKKKEIKTYRQLFRDLYDEKKIKSDVYKASKILAEEERITKLKNLYEKYKK